MQPLQQLSRTRVPLLLARLCESLAATIYHLIRDEFSSAVITFILLITATLVAYLRWRVLPIAPRGKRLRRPLPARVSMIAIRLSCLTA